jgi:hypothetical protein
MRAWLKERGRLLLMTVCMVLPAQQPAGLSVCLHLHGLADTGTNRSVCVAAPICFMQDTAFPDAFKWAHESDPQAQLCINDFSLIEANNGPKLVKIIKQRVWAHNAPIHCIGIQVRLDLLPASTPPPPQNYTPKHTPALLIRHTCVCILRHKPGANAHMCSKSAGMSLAV